MNFNLNASQVKQYELWKEKVLSGVSSDELGIKEYFIFIPHTRGVAVKVVYGKEEIDLTDYDSL